MFLYIAFLYVACLHLVYWVALCLKNPKTVSIRPMFLYIGLVDTVFGSFRQEQFGTQDASMQHLSGVQTSVNSCVQPCIKTTACTAYLVRKRGCQNNLQSNRWIHSLVVGLLIYVYTYIYIYIYTYIYIHIRQEIGGEIFYEVWRKARVTCW